MPIVKADDNTILDTRIFEVEYPYGQNSSLAANEIAENMLSQVDIEGNRHVLFEENIDDQNYG